MIRGEVEKFWASNSLGTHDIKEDVMTLVKKTIQLNAIGGRYAV